MSLHDHVWPVQSSKRIRRMTKRRLTPHGADKRGRAAPPLAAHAVVGWAREQRYTLRFRFAPLTKETRHHRGTEVTREDVITGHGCTDQSRALDWAHRSAHVETRLRNGARNRALGSLTMWRKCCHLTIRADVARLSQGSPMQREARPMTTVHPPSRPKKHGQDPGAPGWWKSAEPRDA